MDTAYKPLGHTSVSPYLVVTGADATITFLVKALGASELYRLAGEDGRIRHAEVRLDDSVLMLADSMEGWPAQSAHVHVYVPDVDAAYQRALAAGAISVQAPVKKEDADKRCGVQDSGGTTWWLATLMA